MTRQRSPPEKSNVIRSDLINNIKRELENGSDLVEVIFPIGTFLAKQCPLLILYILNIYRMTQGAGGSSGRLRLY